jgi:hypothetical protein
MKKYANMAIKKGAEPHASQARADLAKAKRADMANPPEPRSTGPVRKPSGAAARLGLKTGGRKKTAKNRRRNRRKTAKKGVMHMMFGTGY